MMKIKKKLNNNAVLTILNDQEVIVRGKGIGFQKKENEEIDLKKIEKTYHLSNNDFQSRFVELLHQIPSGYLEMADTAIEYGKEKLKSSLNESIYVTLTDHLFMAIERFKEGIPIDNGSLWEIRKYYPIEYEIGLYTLSIIKQEFDLKLPNDEAGFIALHFVNASMDTTKSLNMFKVTKMITDMANIVKYTLNLTVDEESVYYFRFITHLRFFSLRVLSEKPNEESSTSEMLDLMKNRYVHGFRSVVKLEKYLVEKYGYQVSKEEQLYLLIHIEKLIQENKKMTEQE